MELSGIEVSGLAEFAEGLPDNRWYEIRIHVRKTVGGAVVDIQKDVRPVPHRMSPETIIASK